MNSPGSGRRMVVEIGSGSNPVVNYNNQMVVKPEDNYLCIDDFSSAGIRLGQARQELELQKKFREAIGHKVTGKWTVEQRGAQDTGLPEDSVDRVMAINFFGDPRCASVREEVAREISRILGPQGVLSVVETYTPQCLPVDELCQIMGRVGLERVNDLEPYNLALVSPYVDVTGNVHKQSYAIDFGFPKELPGPSKASDPRVGRTKSLSGAACINLPPVADEGSKGCLVNDPEAPAASDDAEEVKTALNNLKRVTEGLCSVTTELTDSAGALSSLLQRL